MIHPTVDFLIAGQGLAGSVLAWYLHKKGGRIYIADPLPAVSSSAIAAGIMHPFTGRRLAKTWMADTLIPHAKSLYNQFSKEFNADLFFESELIEIFTSVQHGNEWNAKSADPSYSSYVNYIAGKKQLPENIIAPLGGISLQSSWLDVKRMIECLRNYFIHENIFLAEKVDEKKLEFADDKVHWNNITAGKVIFCDGYRASLSALFGWLPFVPAKGEIIEVFCPALKADKIFNKSIYIIPTGNDFYKAGATFTWNEIDEAPTEKGLAYLKDELSKLIACDYKITGHAAAVRPTNKDRRPFIGLNPVKKQAGIFNGLGTKGVMLAPWFADKFSDELLFGKPVNKTVSIERYAHLL